MKPTENRKVLETATWQDDLSRQANKATVVSSTSGAKLLKIWKRWHYFTNKEPTVPKLFWGFIQNSQTTKHRVNHYPANFVQMWQQKQFSLNK